jgi:hypothetical protein
MRIILFILSYFAMSFSFGQSIKVVDTDHKISLKAGLEKRIPIKLNSSLSKPSGFFIKYSFEGLNGIESGYFCWDNQCFESAMGQTPVIKYSSNEDLYGKLSLFLKAGLFNSPGSIRFSIHDVSNPEEVIDYQFLFTPEKQSNSDLLFSDDKLSMSYVYPNPTSNLAIIDYRMDNNINNAKITIHNVLGSMVGEFILSPNENQLKINTRNFDPGVYFYTLYVNNENLVTKKMIIKR